MITPEEILREHTPFSALSGEHMEYVVSFEDAIEAMKKYANQKLDEAAEVATCSDASWNAMPKYTVDTQSILDLKDQI